MKKLFVLFILSVFFLCGCAPTVTEGLMGRTIALEKSDEEYTMFLWYLVAGDPDSDEEYKCLTVTGKDLDELISNTEENTGKPLYLGKVDGIYLTESCFDALSLELIEQFCVREDIWGNVPLCICDDNFEELMEYTSENKKLPHFTKPGSKDATLACLYNHKAGGGDYPSKKDATVKAYFES